MHIHKQNILYFLCRSLKFQDFRAICGAALNSRIEERLSTQALNPKMTAVVRVAVAIFFLILVQGILLCDPDVMHALPCSDAGPAATASYRLYCS